MASSDGKGMRTAMLATHRVQYRLYHWLHAATAKSACPIKSGIEDISAKPPLEGGIDLNSTQAMVCRFPI